MLRHIKDLRVALQLWNYGYLAILLRSRHSGIDLKRTFWVLDLG